jgi:uncharacterized protein (DUF2267 family)
MMEYTDFISKVQAYTGIEDPVEARRILEATLETLGERLARVHRQHLAAQLPSRLKEFPLKHQQQDHFAVEEFYNRVASRADINFHKAIDGAPAVCRVLSDAIAAGELKDIMGGLPGEFRDLFGAMRSGAAAHR